MKKLFLLLIVFLCQAPLGAFDVVVMPSKPAGGTGFLLTISGKTTGYYEITYNDKTYRPYEAGEGKEHIFLPVKIDDAGNKTIIIKDIVGGNTSGQKAASIKVARRKIQAIKLMESDEKMRAAEPMVESQNDLVLKTLHTKTDARLWTKGFIPPVKTKISTKFAQLRKATTYQYYHKGIDYSASVGTQVKAVNSGKIIFARSWPQRLRQHNDDRPRAGRGQLLLPSQQVP